MRVLAADVGGTHARLAVFRMEGRRGTMIREERWPSEEYDGLLPILREFLVDEVESFDAACLALAGPVLDGVCRLPNLGWEVEGAELSRKTGIEPLWLINDFDAVAHGVLLLDENELAVLSEGEGRGTDARGPGAEEPSGAGAPGRSRADRESSSLLAVVGAGTGLGVAAVDPGSDPPRVHGSEGGHTDFAAVTEEEWALARFLTRRHERASWERVLCGDGLVDLYRFLREAEYAPEVEAVRAAMAEESGGPAAVVSRHGLAGDDRLSKRALEVFVSAYGRFAGNVALTLGARGGVYVAGGIAPRILDALREGSFMEAFRSMGRMSDYVARIPVRVVLQGDVGLLGAASVAAARASGA
ncbi:MAG TPA: glucokinase [Longimicrobiales bacterium]|nr:glucokinase [Longimicrobiales bacterium]